MKLNLPDNVSSPQDLTALMLEIHDYARWFSQSAIQKRTSSKQTAEPPQLSDTASELLRVWEPTKNLTQTRLDELQTALERFKAEASTMTITLAAPPTNDVKQQLVAWCRHNISHAVLVRFQFNATLLGGMVVQRGSRIFDWSFRRQLLEHRTTFPEVLRRV